MPSNLSCSQTSSTIVSLTVPGALKLFNTVFLLFLGAPMCDWPPHLFDLPVVRPHSACTVLLYAC